MTRRSTGAIESTAGLSLRISTQAEFMNDVARMKFVVLPCATQAPPGRLAM